MPRTTYKWNSKEGSAFRYIVREFVRGNKVSTDHIYNICGSKLGSELVDLLLSEGLIEDENGILSHTDLFFGNIGLYIDIKK